MSEGWMVKDGDPKEKGKKKSHTSKILTKAVTFSH